jgi:hypothetical protein
MNLPQAPGLKRRLAYAKIVRDAHARSRETVPPVTRATRERTRVLEYEIYYNLDDVSVGVIDKCINKTTIGVNDTYDKFCVICQEYVNMGSIIRTLCCSHNYHISCIDRWFNHHTKCPTCNEDVRDYDALH